MATYHAKTDSGRREIETRERRLPPAQRSALILIDGKRSDAELTAMVPQFERSLPLLVEAGLVEAVTPPKPIAPPKPAAPRPQAPSPVLEREPERSLDPSFLARRRDAGRALIDQLGPVGETVAMRIERAANVVELGIQIELAASLLANTRGRRAGAEFMERYGQVSAPPAV
jgi:hypothetical protein